MKAQRTRNRLVGAVAACVLGGVALAAPTAQGAADDITSGLIAYFPLDTNSTDSVASLTGVDTAVSYVPGQVGGAASFNGTASDIVVAGLANALPSGAQSRTLSVWLKKDAQEDFGFAIPAFWGANSMGAGFGVAVAHFPPDETNSAGYATGGGGVTDIAESVPVGVWTNLLATYDGTTVRVYKNGVKFLERNATLNADGTQSFMLGRSPSSSSRYAGLIDEVRIYSRQLTDSEVQALYASAATPPSVAPIPTLSEWGMLVMFALLAGTMVKTARRKEEQSA